MQTSEARTTILSYDTPRIDRISNIERYLLPFNKLPDIKEIKKLPVHVIKRHNYYGQYLVILGVDHRSDPIDSQFIPIRQEFNLWQKKTKETKRIIIIEGGIPDIANIDTEESAIQSEHTERALLSFWAKKNNIEIISGEPKQKEEANEIADTFCNNDEVIAKGLTSKEITAYYYIARHIPQWHRIRKDKQPNFQTYFEQTATHYSDTFEWKDFDFSYNNFIRIHEKLYNSPFNYQDNNFFLDQTVNFKHSDTLVQKVSQVVQDIRDKNLVNLYAKCWDSNISVFSTYGKYHTIRMANILNTFGLDAN